MSLKSAFFPEFHRAGLGRKPLATRIREILKIRTLDAICLAHLEGLLGDAVPSWLRQFKTDKGLNSRKRAFTPILTFWAFLAHVLDAGSSCKTAVTRVQALCAAKKLAAVSKSTSAYCRARARLGAKLLIHIFRHVTDAVALAAGVLGEQNRLLVMDGTTLSMPDTDANRSVYAYAPGQKPGCGFPLMYVLGIFDLRTGACLRVVKSAARRHDSALAWRIIGSLRAGDTLLADRAFCSYAFIAECEARGVHVVMRLHQARDVDMRKGKRLGKGDRLHTWIKSPRPHAGMNAARHAALPSTLTMRIVATQVTIRGRRSETMYVATTHRDPSAHSAAQIAALYLRRWEAELFFDDIKTSQKMDVLRCLSPDMIARELLMHLIAYNLVRMLMAQAEKQRPASQEGRISYKGTLDRVNQWHCTLWGCKTRQQFDTLHLELLRHIAEDVVRPRPGRREPRRLKRRRDCYPLLTQPRKIMRKVPEPPKHYKTAA